MLMEATKHHRSIYLKKKINPKLQNLKKTPKPNTLCKYSFKMMSKLLYHQPHLVMYIVSVTRQ